jgi:hypothetical protein
MHLFSAGGVANQDIEHTPRWDSRKQLQKIRASPPSR